MYDINRDELETYENNDADNEFLDDPNDDDTELLGGDELLGDGGDGLLGDGDGEILGGGERTEEGNQRVRRGLGAFRSSGQQVNSLLTDVDLVFVIDCTGSMEPCLNMVKASAKSLHNDIMAGLGAKNRVVNKLRVKVIAYRDYYFDWADPEHPPMTESEFFTLPDQQEEYAAFVDALEYAGGEDEPESALEALHLAFHSSWMNDPNVAKKRQLIVLFTDASAHPLDDPMRYDPNFNHYYPEGMPESLPELHNEFMSPDVFPADGSGLPTGHRLILFAPEAMDPWKEVASWDETMCRSMDPEQGLEGLVMDEVITFISGSI